MSSDITLIRHYLATLAYCFQYSMRKAPPEFAGFNPGKETMKPIELVRHLNSLLVYVSSCISEQEEVDVGSVDWEESVKLFHDLLSSIENLKVGHLPSGTTFEVRANARGVRFGEFAGVKML